MPVPPSAVDRLLPRPHAAEETEERIAWPTRLRLEVEHATAAGLGEILRTPLPELRRSIADVRLGGGADGAEWVRLAITPSAGPTDEAYRLAIAARGITIEAPGASGLLHGLHTLAQWLLIHRDAAAAGLPGLHVTDRPDFGQRGLLLDVSRDRVPRLRELYRLVDRLAAWKLNQLQLYTEHTFAYRGHERVWRGSSPLTAAEIRRLDAYCRARCVQLVPNQNSFGHLHRWLRHRPYRDLAECPEGIEHPFSDRVEPFSLCPLDLRSRELLADLYAQLLPCFTSPLFNVGCDETIDLARCRSAAACRERGRATVYLEFVDAIHRLAARHGRRIQLWADVLLGERIGAEALPEGAIPLVWGYEADHPFASQLAALDPARREVYVCPGTSSWLSFAGRLGNARGNLLAAARAGRDAGAGGMLITDWGDRGHLQPPPVSLPPLAVGAAVAWNADAAPAPDHLAALLDLHAFDRSGDGPAGPLIELAEAWRLPGPRPRNASTLFQLVIESRRPLTHPGYRGLTAAGLERTANAVGHALDRLERSAVPADDDDDPIRHELHWVGRILSFACELGRARLAAGAERPVEELPGPARRHLLALLQPLIEEHARLWQARSRPGGRRDSVRRLQRLERVLQAAREP